MLLLRILLIIFTCSKLSDIAGSSNHPVHNTMPKNLAVSKQYAPGSGGGEDDDSDDKPSLEQWKKDQETLRNNLEAQLKFTRQFAPDIEAERLQATWISQQAHLHNEGLQRQQSRHNPESTYAQKFLDNIDSLRRRALDKEQDPKAVIADQLWQHVQNWIIKQAYLHNERLRKQQELVEKNERLRRQQGLVEETEEDSQFQADLDRAIAASLGLSDRPPATRPQTPSFDKPSDKSSENHTDKQFQDDRMQNQNGIGLTTSVYRSPTGSVVPSAVTSTATSATSSRATSPVFTRYYGAAPAASAEPAAQSSKIVTSLSKRMESKELTPQQQELKRQADELYVQLVRIRDEAINAQETQDQTTREAKEKEFREKFKQVKPELLFYNDFTSIWPNKSNLLHDSFEFRKYDSTLWRLFDPWDLTTDQSNPQ